MLLVLFLAVVVLLGSGCVSAPDEPVALSMRAGDLQVETPLPTSRVDLLTSSGATYEVRRFPEPVQKLSLELPEDADSSWAVRVHTRRGASEVSLPERDAALTGATVFLEAPLGQGRQELEPGTELEVVLVDGVAVQVALVVEAAGGQPTFLSLAGADKEHPSPRDGERLVLLAHIDGPTSGEVRVGEQVLDFSIVTRSLSHEEARQHLALGTVVFPAEQGGTADLGRPSGRVTLSAGWWETLLRNTPLGFRPRDREVPWGWQAVPLVNRGDDPLSVVLRAQVLGPDGQPDGAFTPRIRGGSDTQDAVNALLRVPAGQRAVGTVPLFVDGPALAGREDQVFTRVIEVVPLGATEPLHRLEAPLYVSRGSTVTSIGLGVALLAALSGVLWTGRNLARWLRRWPTSELTTIALFSSLTFSTGALSQLLAMGFAALLGPFSMLVTGLVDDAVRMALLATLVTLLPRPGTITVAVLLSWMLRGFVLGSFNPTDVLFVGARIAWLEGLLWLWGLTSSGRWRRESRVRRWLRLAGAFGLASVASSATGLVLSAVLFRLYYAAWYVGLVLAGPGFGYVVVACWPATRFADSLRRVEP